MMTVYVDARRIVDEKSFHEAFATAFAFPATYGRNMDAWIDCVGDLRPTSGVILVQLDHAEDFEQRCPNLFRTLLDCTAFVNWRRKSATNSPILALAYDRNT